MAPAILFLCNNTLIYSIPIIIIRGSYNDVTTIQTTTFSVSQ